MLHNAHANFARLIIDPGKGWTLPEVSASSEICGENSIIATGLTESQIATLKFLLALPFMAEYWPYETPTAAECAELYLRLIGKKI